VGHKKYNGLELDEGTGACFVGHGFSRDTKLPDGGSVNVKLGVEHDQRSVVRN